VRLAVALLACSAALVATAARAHQVGLSRSSWSTVEGGCASQLAFARAELAAAVAGLDADGDGTLTGFEAEAARDALEAAVIGRVLVASSGRPCTGTLESVALVDPDGVALDVRWACGTAGASLDVTLPLLGDLGLAHRHLARVPSPDGPATRVLTAGQAGFALAAAFSDEPGAGGLLVMGVEHVLTGWDHLVFLLGLVLVGGRLRSVVAVVTAFTLGHSVTLALATFGAWTPSPRLVEPAIALSVAYVGIENFFVGDVKGRWRITLPFGLVHGWGFAGALREIGLPREDLPAALVSFNVGVEAGQLLALLLVLPLLHALRARGWFRPVALRWASAGIVACGAWWLVTRL
jgi:hypothetical protein